MKQSLLRKLFISIATVLILTFAISVIIGREALESYFLNNKLTELQPQLETIAKEIGAGGHASTYLKDQGFILKAFDLYSKEMDVLEHDLIADMKPQLPFSEADIHTVVKPFISKVLTGAQVATITQSDEMGGYSIVIGEPIRSSGHVIGGLFLLKPVSDFTSARTGFYFTLALSASTALILTLYIIYRIIKPMLMPIRVMTHASEAMASGNYEVRVPENGYGELGELSHSLNILTSKLEHNHQAAVRLEQVRRDYVANVTHELRTPLASIRAMSETLCDQMLHDEEGKQRFYHAILRESIRLQRLIDDMLELSRLQSGSSAMMKSVIQAKPIIERVHGRFSVLAEEMGVHFIITKQASTMPDFFGHADRVEQVLTILLDNALKFTEPDGSVILNATWEEDAITISISDTGIGIDEEELPYVFDRFYKSDKSHTGMGTGLGLSLAKEILTQLKETIAVESNDRGTSFFFTLHRK
ncbi:hypothetical protein BBD42_25120 [Paenibacillus sp. BIHB 4019]|uniref:histidine kinase n=1 Tax=Paenibacillus sp. BIHB 4019 TaxID=1870819 RepID=A0A1B2DNV7_9BACL|nr:HAMP domain-containing sensor histidine kinase [Paenibacillus sp. BIHB 4019]ANY69399.1 hypothetical protein BBD42_25120 [Paenibacillus sp. BIHB 4019]